MATSTDEKPTKEDKEAFAEQFKKNLREKIQGDEKYKEYHNVTDDVLTKMALQFVDVMVTFKKEYDSNPELQTKDPRTKHSTQGWELAAWTPESSAAASNMSAELDKIFEPIGGVKTGDNKSAFWSGEVAKKKSQEQKERVSLETTLPGFMMDTMYGSIKEVCFANDNLAQMTLWNALSKSYAKGATGDVDLYLVDGVTGSQTVFWGTELGELRKKTSRWNS